LLPIAKRGQKLFFTAEIPIFRNLIHVSLAIALVLFWVGAFEELGHASTVNAASCSANDVNTAIASASDGDTVLLPPCSSTWSGTATPPITFCKSITLQGSGVGITNITGVEKTQGLGGAIYVANCANKTIRITNFSMISGGIAQGLIFFAYTQGSTIRVDHMSFDGGTNGDGALSVYGGYGVADHNTFMNSSLLVQHPVSGDSQMGNTSWTLGPSFGTGNAFYFEDNTFNDTVYTEKDCADGGRVVYRYNTFTSYGPFTHGFDTTPRSCFELDAYNNTFTGAGFNQLYYMFRYRGGSGLLYNNLWKGNVPSMGYIHIENYRSYSPNGEPILSGYGSCDGTSSYDGNTSATAKYHGWPCRDQIGRGTNQGSYPLYSWNNCIGSSLGCSSTDQATISVVGGGTTDYTPAQIIENRDFYQMVASFNGTAGVGHGPYASLPASCAVNSDTGKGPAYWATDLNKLYQCSATNTWTLYYTPFTYPHPLVGSQTVSPPTGLSASVI